MCVCAALSCFGVLLRQVEAIVKAQMDLRQQQHKEHNEAMQLTPDQRREKRARCHCCQLFVGLARSPCCAWLSFTHTQTHTHSRPCAPFPFRSHSLLPSPSFPCLTCCVDRKLQEKTTDSVHVALFRVASLRNPKHKFKVQVNAEQFNLTGAAVMTNNMNIVVVEGGPKNIKKYKRLMTHRIQWSSEGASSVVALLARQLFFSLLLWKGEFGNRLPFTHARTQPQTDNNGHSLTPSLTHSFTHSLLHSLTHSLTHSLLYSLTHSFTHSLLHSLLHSHVHSLTHSLLHSLTHSFTHSLTHTHTHTRALNLAGDDDEDDDDDEEAAEKKRNFCTLVWEVRLFCHVLKTATQWSERKGPCAGKQTTRASDCVYTATTTSLFCFVVFVLVPCIVLCHVFCVAGVDQQARLQGLWHEALPIRGKEARACSLHTQP